MREQKEFKGKVNASTITSDISLNTLNRLAEISKKFVYADEIDGHKFPNIILLSHDYNYMYYHYYTYTDIIHYDGQWSIHDDMFEDLTLGAMNEDVVDFINMMLNSFINGFINGDIAGKNLFNIIDIFNKVNITLTFDNVYIDQLLIDCSDHTLKEGCITIYNIDYYKLIKKGRDRYTEEYKMKRIEPDFGDDYSDELFDDDDSE